MKWFNRYSILRTLFVGLLLVGINLVGVGRPQTQSTESDSLKVAGLVNIAQELYLSGQSDTAMIILNRALENAINNDLKEGEAGIYLLMARITEEYDEWNLTLRFYLKAANLFSELGMSDREADIYSSIGSRYMSTGVYDKSVEYFLLEYSLQGRDEFPGRAVISGKLAESYFLGGRYEQAANWYDTCYYNATYLGSEDQKIESLYGSAKSYSMIGNNLLEREYLERLLRIEKGRGEFKNLADIYNSLGMIDFGESDIDGAIEYFNLAVDMYSEAGVSAESSLANLAVCYQNLGNNKMSGLYFEDALRESKRYGNLYNQARLEHILAVLSYNKGDIYHAGFYSKSAIESARVSGNLNILQKSYETYSEVLKAGNDFIMALEYYEKYLSLRDSLSIVNKMKEQELARRVFEASSYEQQLRLSLASEEIKDLALKNLRVEAEKREKDFKLIERERELERSETERLQQSLALDRERYNRVLQEKEISDLEQERAIQQLELVQRENAERELLREKRLLESESRQRELELANELESKKRIKWMVVLLGLIAVTILFYLISSRRKNLILTARKKEIEQINEDLEQKNLEVSVQNRQILEQSEIIEEKNQSITDSIEYAYRIQSAVLPPIDFIEEWEMDNFVLFKPKDIVSGDFYWGMRRGDLMCFAAADCTGHGVPGAFMSMLGTAYLNDIVNSRPFNNAADILNMLREEVIQALRQRGVEGETQDGMDISLCVYDIKKHELHYAGANNPLYMVCNDQFNKINADKMPIGIHRFLDRPFTNHTLKIASGDIIYLFSDGYADQFGGAGGKKFKYKEFREMLFRSSRLAMSEQKEIIEKIFEDWRGENEQVDDVLVIGVKFS